MVTVGHQSGGSIQGLAAESSSFRMGLFHETVLEMQVLLADGRLLRCSQTRIQTSSMDSQVR